MEISPGIKIVGASLWLEQEQILIVNDLHLGYEQELHNKGVLVPRYQLKDILEITKKILDQTKPQKIIINGDLKHEFGRISSREWKEVLEYLDFLLKSCQEIIIIQGNHDPIIKPIAEKRQVKVVSEIRVGDIHIVHGDELVKTNAKRIIIGHEHTAITIREGSKFEKYKCFLKGKWNRKELIVVPSFNPLLEGTDILKENLLSPFLEDISKFEVYVISNSEVFEFGTVNRLMKGK
ncbi:MAG: metallophosphoesterase [Candidatus Woesearchaeota archaeon]